MKRSFWCPGSCVPTSGICCGAYDHKGKPNALVAAWGGICSSDPPSIAISNPPFTLYIQEFDGELDRSSDGLLVQGGNMYLDNPFLEYLPPGIPAFSCRSRYLIHQQNPYKEVVTIPGFLC